MAVRTDSKNWISGTESMSFADWFVGSFTFRLLSGRQLAYRLRCLTFAL